MRPLKEWLDAQNVPHEVDPTCQTPTRIERKSFSSLSLEEFACPPELLLAPRYIGATAGTAIWSDQLIAHGNFLRVLDWLIFDRFYTYLDRFSSLIRKIHLQLR